MRSFVILLSVLCFSFSLISQDVDPGFDPELYEPATITHVAFDSEGNTYFTGNHSLVNNKQRYGISKLGTTGALNEDFNIGSGYNGTVTGMLSLSNDKLLIIGDFTEFNGIATGPMVQINQDGSINEGFAKATSIVSSIQNPITNVIELPNGNLLLYGSFSDYNGFATNSIVVLNQGGIVDESFKYEDENVMSVVNVAHQSSGKMVVALNRNNSQSGLIIRLNPDGSKDETFQDFDTGSNSVYKIMAQSTDKLLVLTDASGSDQPSVDLFRLNADGTNDDSFDLGEGIVGYFDDFQLDENDAILIGSISNGREEGTINGNASGLISRIGINGTFDKSLVIKKSISESSKVALNENGEIFIYGFFPFFPGVDTKGIARLNDADQVDVNWRADLLSVPETILVEQGNSNPTVIPRFSNRLENVVYTRSLFPIYEPEKNPWSKPFDVEEIRIAKRFSFGSNSSYTAYGGGPHVSTGQSFVMLNEDGGRLSPSWEGVGNNIKDNWVNDVVMNEEWNVFLAGSFTGINGQTDGPAGIMKFDIDGNTLESFVSPFGADSVDITDIELQDDGKIIVVGTYSPMGEANLKVGIVRLNEDGSFDESFDRSLNFTGGIVQKIEIVEDGYIVVGDFTGINSSESRKGIAKINLDGSLNTEFNGNNTWVGNKIYQVKVVEDAVYVGGDFTEYQGQKVHGLIKLNLDGTLDNSFILPSKLSAIVYDFEVYPDDEINIILAGKFYDSLSNRKLSAVKLGIGLDGEVTNLSVENVSYDMVSLSWQKSSTNEEHFYIERSKNNEESFNFSRTIDANVTVYEDNELTETGITYYYRVRASKGNFNSEYSNIVEVDVPQRPLSTPTNLTLSTFKPSYLIIEWQDANTEETGFSIERSKNDMQNFNEISSVSSNKNTFEDSSFETGATYYYRVKAFKGDFSSEYSNVIMVTVPPKPLAPSDLTGNIISAHQVDLTWTDNSDNEETFQIIKTVNQGPIQSLGHIPANQTTYSDINVEPGQVLTYYVVASNEMGSSTSSNLFEITMPIVAGINEDPSIKDDRINYKYDPITYQISFELNNPAEKIKGYQIVSGSGIIKVLEDDLETQKLNLSLSENSSGIYLLQVTSDREKYIVKIIKN